MVARHHPGGLYEGSPMSRRWKKAQVVVIEHLSKAELDFWLADFLATHYGVVDETAEPDLRRAQRTTE